MNNKIPTKEITEKFNYLEHCEIQNKHPVFNFRDFRYKVGMDFFSVVG